MGAVLWIYLFVRSGFYAERKPPSTTISVPDFHTQAARNTAEEPIALIFLG